MHVITGTILCFEFHFDLIRPEAKSVVFVRRPIGLFKRRRNAKKKKRQTNLRL